MTVCYVYVEYRCDSTDKLKSKLDDLRCLLSDPVAFKNIFRFAYDFAKVSCKKVMLHQLLYFSFLYYWPEHFIDI